MNFAAIAKLRTLILTDAFESWIGVSGRLVFEIADLRLQS